MSVNIHDSRCCYKVIFFLKSKLNVRKVFLQALFCRSQKAFVYAQGDGSEFRVEVYEEVVVEGDECAGAG